MRMSGYTKLFNSILASTVWREDHTTRIVWITMLAMADRYGVVEGSIPGLADFARVSVEECRKALEALQSPDPDSRTVDHEGRRIAPVDGGWQILNHAKYRAKMSADERREYLRLKQAEYRSQKKGIGLSDTVSDTSTPLTHTEAKAEADPKAKEQDQERSAASADSLDAYALSCGTDKPGKAKPSESPDALKSLWNARTTAPVVQCRELSDKRRRLACSRLRERPLSEWREVIDRIQASPFCRGENDRGWVATFDWLLRPDTAVKVLEGTYDPREAVQRSTGKPTQGQRMQQVMAQTLQNHGITQAPMRPVAPGRPGREIGDGNV